LRRSLAMIGCAALLFVACSSDGRSDGDPGSAELTVFAAASLTDAFTQMGKDFEAANEGVTVTFNFGSSGDLAPQIASEGTADVFASASERYMDEVRDDPGVTSRVDFVRNELVVITPPGDPARIRTFDDLARPGVQLVLGAEGVPVGDYARAALDDAGILEAALGNVVSNEEDNAAVVAKVVAGEADAGIVYTSDVTSAVAPDVFAVEIPDDVNVIVTYPIAVVSGSPNAALARSFVDHVTGADGQATLEQFGFLPPPAA
jgi:molybdate transport system substrate-binding protein